MRFARISCHRSGVLALLLALMLPILAACGGAAPTTTSEVPTAAAAAPTAAPSGDAPKAPAVKRVRKAPTPAAAADGKPKADGKGE